MRNYINIGYKPYGVTQTGVNRAWKRQDNNKFDKILNQKIKDKDLKVSQHAKTRMEKRNITLSSTQREKLVQAVNKAEKKGIRESLILADDLAFIVSIKNKTIITVIDGPNIKENVFTNIDGAVVI